MPKDDPLFTPGELSGLRQREASLTARVSALMENLIVENRLQPGDRLPAVRELAEQFGVSRTVVREAIGGLAARGLLQVRHGSGTTVCRPTTRSVAQSMALLLRVGQTDVDYAEVYEVRRLLEIEIAGLAAERRTAEELGRIEQNVRELEAIVNERLERERYVATDMAFHTALAQATHNRLFVLLLDSVVDALRGLRQMTYDLLGSHAHATRHHRAIFEQVKKRSYRGARRAMRDHLTDSEELMRQASALRGQQARPTAKEGRPPAVADS